MKSRHSLSLLRKTSTLFFVILWSGWSGGSAAWVAPLVRPRSPTTPWEWRPRRTEPLAYRRWHQQAATAATTGTGREGTPSVDATTDPNSMKRLLPGAAALLLLTSPLRAHALVTQDEGSLSPSVAVNAMQMSRQRNQDSHIFTNALHQSKGIWQLARGVHEWLASVRANEKPFLTSNLLSTIEIDQNGQSEYSMLDEVWTLVDKYYIDRSFNGMDWKTVKERYRQKLTTSLNPAADEPAIVSEMVQSLRDKYSRILDADAYARIQKYDLIGVGVSLMPDPTTQRIIVGAPPVPGSASARAGLQEGDWVTAINGRSTNHRNAFDIIDQISEEPNAPTLDMSVVPREHVADVAATDEDAASSPFRRSLTLPRAFAQVKDPVVYKISETRPDGTRVGYIRISEFNALVKSRLDAALDSLVNGQGANALVLDIRHNGGGAFQSAVEISSLFYPDRVATYVVDGSAALIPFKTTKTEVKVPANVPIVIWIDGLSASASEVFAGSMHDNCRAVLMGDQSFGKGLIQAVYGLKNGAGLVLTVARYVTPAGVDIQGKGIQPDIPGHVSLPVPGFLSDTSPVDFADVRQRLDSEICKIPTPAM